MKHSMALPQAAPSAEMPAMRCHCGCRERMCFRVASIGTASAMLAYMPSHAMAACARRYWRRAASDDAPPTAQAQAASGIPPRDVVQ